MADSPLYYGSSKSSSPMYYGGGAKPAYGGKSPMYYGARPYGQYGQYGSYGAYGGTSPHAGEDGSIVGTITLSRILRVVAQRWLSVFVFLLIGIIVAFAVYRISPTIYEARSEFTMDMRRSSSGGRSMNAIDQAMVDYGSDYAEIFNTRLSDWRSDKIVAMITQEYRSSHPAATDSDDEIMSALSGSKLELQRHSRIITITVRSKSPKLAAGLANAYASAIEAFTDEENKARCDKAVQQIHGNVEKKRREVEKIAKQLLEFRTANKVDNLRSSRDTAQQSLTQMTTEILRVEAEETQLGEWEKMLADLQNDPESFGSIPTDSARATEIANEYQNFLNASTDYAKLQLAFTDNHPDVVAKGKELEMAKKRFLDAVARALQSCRSTLKVTRNRLATLRAKYDELKNDLASYSQRVVFAESSLGILEADFAVANHMLEDLIMGENKARLDAEANNEIVRVGRPAGVPGKPVLPNPLVIFGAGIVLSLALGFLFVLVVDNIEDTVVNLADIEGRLALKVLAVFPHVRRKSREQVAKFAVEDKYSSFAEAVAGFRNLLDSPRYEAMSQCLLVISTQPGEGKTITSTSVAISYAQTGRKVLHVDFDLRRPRLARVWGIELAEAKSFSHALQNAGGQKPDFSSLVTTSSVPNLDVICSLPPDGVTPASIFGSSIVSDFFEWARANYDRIIVDSPPFGIVGDVVSLAVQVDSVIIMCCPDRTHFKPIQYCARSLTEAGANILGVIVNDVEVSSAAAFSPHARHGYGYGYGYGYGRYGGYYRSSKKRRAGDGDNPAPETAPATDGQPPAAETPAPEKPRRVANEEFTDEE